MLKRIKQTALKTLKAGGISALAHDSRWRRRRLAILAYHGISIDDEHLWDGSQFIEESVFRGRMKLLKDLGCSVLPLGEAVERLYAGKLPERAVALTFDDGTADFRSKALPVLREFGFPATLYLTTFYTEYPRPVFDLMTAYLLWKGRGGVIEWAAPGGGAERLDLRDEAGRLAARDRIFAYARARRLKAPEKDSLAAALAERLQIDYGSLCSRGIMRNLAPAEVAEVAAAGVEVQLHTHRHRVPMDRALFLREIEDNRASIRRMTGRDAVHFCYPSGVHDPAFLPWLKEARVASATTCVRGLASPESDPLLLPRLLDVSGLSDVEFEGLLTGVAFAIPRRRAP